MATPPYIQCLLFLVQGENAPVASKSDVSPRNRTQMSAYKSDVSPGNRTQMSAYALIPHFKRYDKLCKIFSDNGVTVLDDGPLDALLTDAVKTKKVEIVEILLKKKLVDPLSQRLLIFVEPFNNEIIPALLTCYQILKPLDRRELLSQSICSALEEENFHKIKSLITFGADIRLRSEEGGTLLHLAVQMGYKQSVRLLLEHGASVSARTLKDLTPLHVAALHWTLCLTVPELLIQHGADINATTTTSEYKGATPLHMALLKRNIELAKLLLDNGAHVDADCCLGSVLNCAVLYSGLSVFNSNCVTFVLSHRPDVNSAKNREALKTAFKYEDFHNRNQKKIIELLLDYGFNIIPEDAKDAKLFLGVIRFGSLELVEKLLNWGANVHSRFSIDNKTGFTPLHQAARECGGDMIRLLLDFGADVSVKSDNGETPLRSAALVHNVEAVKCLLTHGASFQSDPHLLHVLIGKTNHEMVDFLVKNGADPNGLNDEGETPLDIAMLYSDACILEVLFRHGGLLSSNSERPRRALQMAIGQEYLHLVKVLAQNCVDVEVIMKDLLIRAIQSETVSVVKYLLESGDLHSSTFQNGSILNTALEKRNEEIVVDILEHDFVKLSLIAESGLLKMVYDVCNYHSSSDDDSPRNYMSVNLKLLKLENRIRLHLVAVHTAHLSINKEASYSSLQTLIKGPVLQKKKCQNQLDVMKSEKIGNTDVTFFRILNASLPEMLRYTKLKSLIEVLKENSFGVKFPYYSGIIFKRFRRVYFRRKLIDLGTTIFKVIFARFPGSLPCELIETIISYLSNQNLQFFISAFQFLLPPEVSIDVSDVNL